MTEKTSYSPGEPIWLDLGTPDLDASIAFYGSLFGWTGVKGPEEFGGYTTMSKDGKSVAGIMPLMQEGQPPTWTCYVCTDDADKTTGLVTASGGTVVAAPMDVGTEGRMALYVDPTGAFFGVWQPRDHIGAQLVGAEGTFAWSELATRDVAAAKAFYEALFGWGAHEGEGYTEFQHGGTSVAGCMDMPPGMPAQVPAYWMPYFAAADPAAQSDRATSLGGSVLVPMRDFPGGRFAVVQDQFGASFGLLDLRP